MKNNKIYLYVLGIFIICLVGFGIYYYFNDNKDETTINLDEILKENSFSVIDEDEEIDWTKYSEKTIALNNESVTINDEGIYVVSGKISNGSITIDTEGNVKLILNNVTITNNNGPAINIINAKNTIIELADGSVNTVTDGSNYSNSDYDGCIYSKDDLILQGSGKLIVNAKYQDGIVSKDDLKIVSGVYEINAIDDAIRGKDSVYIMDGTFVINASGDGIKATNDTDTSKGNIKIDNGKFTIVTQGDGIQAESKLVIENGTFEITSKGNSDDSAKGIKAGNNLIVYNGTISINSTDDGIHTDGDMVITNGNITIKSGDDGIHADGMITISGGEFNITASEGIEATYVKIDDGVINISASDDGINAGKKSTNYDVTVEINGGNITISMGQGDTDGIDSNGNIYINGGTINITGQSPFDYDGEAKYTDGKLIVNGEETTTITNQFGGMMNGGMQRGGMSNGEMPNGGMQDNRQGGNRRR